VWMGTETDQDLLQLNIEHSGRVACIFHDAVRQLAPDLCYEEIYARTYLFSHLIGAFIRLAAVSEEASEHRLLMEVD
ncbi:TetR/AcrR family transcriptional regulator, partial [Rhizobium ruizarguesonis]